MKSVSARNIAIAIVAATGLLVAGIAVFRLLHVREPHVEVDRSRYPVMGVDLSAHNGVVNFDSLSDAGVHFAYLKASEGECFRDPAFVRNYAGARRTGIAVGAYHFFRFDADGRKQARNVLAATVGCVLDLPTAIDVEESGNPAGIPTALVAERLETLVAHLQAAGRRVIIYTNKNGDARFMRHRFDNIAEGDPELWICSFTDPPLNRRPWRLWQHSHRSRLPGVDGAVDLNTFNGSVEEWEAWLDSQKSKPASAAIQ